MEFQEFEWDENKRLKNLVQHKIDFEDVWIIFERPFLSKRSDRKGEERYLAIGFFRSRLCYNCIYNQGWPMPVDFGAQG
jgi:hypothetical protein